MVSSKTNELKQPGPAKGLIKPFLPTVNCRWWVAVLSLFMVPYIARAQVTHYSVTTSAGMGSSGTYNVGQGVTFQIQALDASGQAVTTYNNSATIGFYVSDGSLQLSDPQALIGVYPGGSTIVDATATTGTAVLPFTNGILNLGAIFRTGTLSEQMFIQDGTVPVSVAYPDEYPSLPVTWVNSPAYVVNGFSQSYFLQDANMDGSPVSYFAPNGPYDNLITDPTTLTAGGLDVGVTLNVSPDVTNANTYAVTGINAGNAYGNATVDPSLYFQKLTGATSPVSVWVILDYNGTLTDYNNPPTTGPNADSVFYYYLNDVSPVCCYNTHLTSGNSAGSAGPSTQGKKLMTNGQIIVRVWSLNAGTSVIMRYQSLAQNNLAVVNIPFSSNNILPVKETLSPTQYLAGASTSVTCLFLNNAGSNVSTIIYKLPANVSGNWNFPAGTFPTTVNGYPGSSVAYANPSGSTDGAVTLTFNSPNYLGNTQSATLVMPGTVANIGNGAAWDFGMMAVTSASGLGLPLDNSGVTVLTEGQPAAPTGFTAAPVSFDSGGDAVSLSWSQDTDQGANGYILTRTGGAAFTPVTLNSSSATSYIDGTAVNLTAYNYQLLAFNTVSQSNPSAAGPVTPFVNPATPGPVTALTGGSTIQVSWAAPAPVPGSYAVTGYQVWRDTQAGMGTATLINTVGLVTSYNDTSVPASGGTTYYYALASLDSQYSGGAPGAAHISAYSGVVSGEPPGNPPTGLAANLTVTPTPVIQLSWTGPASVLNSPVTGYIIDRAVTTGAFSALTTVGTLSYNDSAVTAGSYYVYEVQAVDSLGVTSNPSSAVTGRVGPPAPGTPTPIPSGSAVTLVWPALANSNGETIASYVIYRNSSSLGSAVTTANASMTFSDTTALVGTDYFYQVEAVDASGVTGSLSAGVSSARLPQPPTGLSALADSAVRYQVHLSWAAPSPAEGNLQNYFIYQGKNGAAATLLATVGTSPVTYLDVSLAPADAGSTIAYYLQDGNDLGGMSVTTATVALQIPPNPPGTPTPTSSSGAITLTWTANPAPEKVLYYTVYRNPGSGFVSVGRVTSPATTFIDTPANGVSTGINYAYEITATNPGGGAGIPGGESLFSTAAAIGLLPQVPQNLAFAAIDASNNISVTWTNVTGADPNATGVSLFVNANSAVTAGAALANVTPASAVSFFDNGVFNGAVTGESPDTTYYYWLQTRNPYGVGGLAGPVSHLTYPAPVSLVSATLAPDGISRVLNWTLLGTPDVTQYKVYRELLGTNNFINTQTFNAAGLTMPVTGNTSVQPGQVYYYKITATNSTGEGSSATTISVGIPPSAPVSLTAVSGISSGGVTVDLSWADPNVSTENVTGYTVYRSAAVTGIYAKSGSVTATLNSFADSTATGGNSYYYMIAADGADGEESNLNTTNAVAVTAFALPNAPAPVTETDGNASVVLGWNTAAATTYPIASYNVYRYTSGGVTQKANASPIVATAFTDSSGMVNGTTYYFLVQAVDNQGHLSPYSSPVTALPVVPPGVPGNVGTSSGNNANQVTWVTSTAGTLPIGGYVVERIALAGPTTTYTQVAGNLTGYVDNSASNGATYVYFVEAVDNNSQGVTTGAHISGFSAGATIVTGQLTVNPPSNLVATGGVGQVSVSWIDSTGGAPVTGYQVYRAQSQPTTTAYSLLTSAVTNTSPLVDGTAANGSTYGYYFVAYSSGVPGAASATVYATAANPPSTPAGLATADANTAVTLTWAANPPVNNVAVSRYVVYRDGSAAATVYGASVTVYADTGLPNGTPVTYNLAAVNLNGTLGAQSAAVTGNPYDLNGPALASTSGATAVTLTWALPTTISYAPASAYSIYRSTVSGGYNFAQPLTVLSGGTFTFTDSSAVPGQLYDYVVKATDGVGHVGPVSNEVADGAANPPNPPSSLTAVAGDTQILLDWAAPVPAAGSLPVSEYIVVPSTGSPVTLPAGQTWYLQTGLGDPTAVSYTVETVDASGQVTAAHVSATASAGPVTTSTSNLNPPTALSAVAQGPASILLTWALPNDMGKVVSSFYLYRSRTFGGTYTRIATIANPSYGVISYLDGGLSPNTTYYYQVSAYYTLPTPATESPDSNHASATTPAPSAGIPPVTVGQMAFDANLVKPETGQTLGIYYIVPNTGSVELVIYNVAGHPVRYLYPGLASANVQAGTTWDMKDRNGNIVASGIYLIEIKADGFHQVKKVAVVK